jgi:hypothetical protein
MATWSEFVEAAPSISAIFDRRHSATGRLCLLATIRRDGSPRISPIEPSMFEGELWLVGMPGTTKFLDLARDPRFCVHTATVDTEVTQGDAKLWGRVRNVRDQALQRRWADALFAQTGFDLREQQFDPFFAADIASASAVEVADNHMDVTIWKSGEPERVIRKH